MHPVYWHNSPSPHGLIRGRVVCPHTQWGDAANGVPLDAPVCAVAIESGLTLRSPAPNGPPNFFILGVPFISKFPGTFLGPGARLAMPAIQVPRMFALSCALAVALQLPRSLHGCRGQQAGNVHSIT